MSQDKFNTARNNENNLNTRGGVSYATDVHLSQDICTKLKPWGVLLDPSISLSGDLLYRAPANIIGGCQLYFAQIDAYTAIGHDSAIRSSSIGRYCSIAHKVEIGLAPADTACLSTSVALVSNSPFASLLNGDDEVAGAASGSREADGADGDAVDAAKANATTANNTANADSALLAALGRGESPTGFKRLSHAVRKQGDFYSRATIGHDVWIGTFVRIPKNVTIGTGAVIGAGSVITHDVPPYAVVAGSGGGTDSHGIIRRYRFSDEVIADLLASKWWEYDLPKVMQQWQQEGRKLPLNNVQDFLALLRNEDVSSWPRIASSWVHLHPISSAQVQLRQEAPDYKLEGPIPQKILRDPAWI